MEDFATSPRTSPVSVATLATFRIGAPFDMHERRLIPLSSVQPAKVSWLWENRVPFGSITILEGDPGQSKSLLTNDIIARLTTGRAMPKCDDGMPCAGAVLLQAEDQLATTKANLEAAGADVNRVFVFDKNRFATQPLLLPEDLPLLETAVASVRARLVVIDPVSPFLHGNPNVDQDVRRALAPVAAFAERAGVAILLVRHLTKAGGSNTLYRGAGSVAFIALARSTLLVANDPDSDDPHRHVLALAKTNLASAASLAYRTQAKGDGLIIEWLGESRQTAQDLTALGRAQNSSLSEATYVLYSLLGEGPVWASEAIQLAAKAGVAKRTLDRAKHELGVLSRKRGSGKGSRWVWELPADETRLKPYKEKDIDDLMDRLIFGEDDPPLPGDEWKHGHTRRDEVSEDEDDGEPVTP